MSDAAIAGPPKAEREGKGSRTRRSTSLPTEADPLTKERLDLERERLKLERQKLAIEVRLKRRELSQPGSKSWKELLANPVSLVIVGGFITVMTTVVSNYFNVQATAAAESLKADLTDKAAAKALEADLIKKFVEGPNPETVRQNLRFLLAAQLLPAHAAGIQSYLDTTNEQTAPQVNAKGDEAAVDLVDSFEGFQPKPVLAADGTWVIGYGHSEGVGPTTPPVTEEEARKLLADDLKFAVDAVDKLVTVPLTPNQKSALVSFVSNVGPAAFARSNLLKKINDKQFDQVPDELRKFATIAGRTSPFLAKRREEEIALWNRKE